MSNLEVKPSVDGKYVCIIWSADRPVSLYTPLEAMKMAEKILTIAKSLPGSKSTATKLAHDLKTTSKKLDA